MYQGSATSPNTTPAEHPLALEGWPRAVGSARHLAGRLGHRRGAGPPRVDRRVEMRLVPELRAERIVLEQVHVVEALGRVVARVLDERVVRPAQVSEPAGANRLYAVGLGVGDLRLRQPGDAARPRPRVA